MIEPLKMVLSRLSQIGFFPVLLVVTALSLWPGHGHPPSSPWSDKFGHALAYFTLGLLLSIGWRHRSVWSWCLALGGLLVWGAILELLQGLPVIGRTSSLLDLLANAGGLILAFGLAFWFKVGRSGQTPPV